MANSRPAVLITGAGTVTCQSIIKALRAQDELDVCIVTVDASEQVAGRYFSDYFYRVPMADDPQFVPALLEICREREIRLLIPIVDYEFSALSSASALFAQFGCTVAISPPDVIRVANDKLATNRFWRANGFGTARTWNAQEARAHAETLSYPVFIKPAIDGRSSIDCYRVEHANDLHRLVSTVPSAMVQEFIDAPEYTADVLADFASQVKGAVVRHRIETKGGVSYKGVTVDDPEMVAEIVRMVRLLGIVGPANIQAFRRGEELLFNEINPRFSGALTLTVAAGLNSPLMLLQMALGLAVPDMLGRTRCGVTMLRYWNEVFIDPSGAPIYPRYHLWPDEGQRREEA